MSDTPSPLRTRLSHDLRRAMKERDKVATMTLRSLLEALDNASAVPLTAEHTPVIGRSADVPRKAVTEQEYERILQQEAASLHAAASEYEQIGRSEAAARVRAELDVVLRYIDLWRTTIEEFQHVYGKSARLLVLLPEETERPQKQRQPGSAKGILKILSEDNEHLNDFSDYMP